MEDHFENGTGLDPTIELLSKLAHQALLGRLPRLELPAGKLPVPLEVRALLPAGGEDSSVSLDHRRGNDHRVSGHRIR